MAVNITLTGNLYDGNGVMFTGAEIYYQAYFYKVNSGSSSSTWSDPRISILGQYNFNLADSDLLTTAGNASSGDVVMIVFWKGTSTDRLSDCSSLEEWSVLRVVLGTGPGMLSSDTYVNEAQVKPNICPNLSWNLQATGLVSTSVTATNSSTDTHQWTFMGTTFYQRNTWYTTLMTINAVDNSVYSWGDTTQDTVAGAGNGSHSWSAPGDYDISLVIEDECGCTVTGTDQIRIYNRAPVPNIVMTPSNPDPNTPVSFQYTGTDVDDTITNISWLIGDDGTYGSTDTFSDTNARDDIVPHTDGLGTDWCGTGGASGAFTNPGTHTVAIEISWWDGFTTQSIIYSENFTQARFTGPTVDFTQDPPEADLLTQATFTNASTNVERVGTALPDCTEYDWTWTDNGTPEVITDQPFSYELVKSPTTADCQVELCASWNDGWDSHYTCVEKDVVFGTVVTISEEDCFFSLNIIGTSGDGSVTGYSWTVASGISETGPWVDTWTTPTGIDQNDKKVCFTAIGWYRITGYVYGTGATTSDSETLYIDVVCPSTTSGIEVISHIWNGTGALDVGGDWIHQHYGTESTTAAHTGTNGLDASGMTRNDKIWFNDPSSTVDGNLYDALVMWVNVREWQANKDVTVELHTLAGANVSVNLSRYLTTDATNFWQKVSIPLTHFGNTGSFNIDRLRLWPTGNIGLWLDDIYFSMGAIVGIPVCDPVIESDEFGTMAISAVEIKPSMQAKEQDNVPDASITFVDTKPNFQAKEVEIKPNIKSIKAFPPPSIS